MTGTRCGVEEMRPNGALHQSTPKAPILSRLIEGVTGEGGDQRRVEGVQLRTGGPLPMLLAGVFLQPVSSPAWESRSR